jgi:cysteine dioxygenase
VLRGGCDEVRELRRVAIDELVAGLRGLPESEFTREGVLAQLQGVVLEPDTLTPYTHFSPERYTRNLVFRNELFEVILICWGIGQSTPIHNHDNQLGWVTVQQGMLSLTNYRRISCAMGGPGQDPKRCRAGFDTEPVVLEEISRIDVTGIGAVTTTDRKETIHQICNLAAFAEPAVTVHVYSRPIDSCVVYDLDARTCRRTRLSYFSEYGRVVAPV